MELPSVDSTNNFLSRLLSAHPAEGTTVFSPNQTAGRGQQGNTWHTEPGQNIACSVLFKPSYLTVGKMFVLNKAVALALADGIQALLPDAEVLLKWPNDILVNRKKIAGILIENQIHGDVYFSAVVGFGVNVNQVNFDEKHGAATSLALISGQHFELKTVLNELLEQLDRRYLALRAGKHEQIEQQYLQRMFAYQEETLMEIDGEEMMAMPIGVDAHGRLAVQVKGVLRYFGVKEIRFLL